MLRDVSLRMWILLLCVLVFAGCGKPQKTVVVYTALDRMFSEPILERFEAETGIRVLPKYDTEATKTVGLVNAIRAEKERPRCDVFWNNEIVNTLRLKEEGLLASFHPEAAKAYPETFRDADGYWSGFAARARVLIVNTNLVKAGEEPTSIRALGDPKWRGRAGIAKPLFGTTATHAACLFAHLGEGEAKQYFERIKANDVQVQSGNRTVALNVGQGNLAFGMTDTDDCLAEMDLGSPVKIVYPDSAAGELGVLFIPNTLAMIKNAPHPEEARQLIEYLLSPEVEGMLAAAKSSQIPLNPNVSVKPRVKTPVEVSVMKADFSKAAKAFATAAEYIEQTFLK